MTAVQQEFVPVADISDVPEAISNLVEFVEPILGFPDERAFSLTAIEPGGSLFALRSLRTPTLRFIVASPGRFFPAYAPVMDEHDVLPLGLAHNDEVHLLVIVSVQTGIADATANLLAPVVLVAGRGIAMQVLLTDVSLPLRAPLIS